jgi:hypothetical protein
VIQIALLEKLETLPEALQTEVLHYVEFLSERYASTKTDSINTPSDKRRLTGAMKGTFTLPLADDFDEPLEDFEEYL